MPTNSATITPALAVSRQSMASTVQRGPKRSRIRSESPSPVTAPMRAHCSWTTIIPSRITSITQISS